MSARAFSLVELLVVVSIIAVLASLLLPAIGLVREQAKSTKCRSNLRQIGVGCQAYASDHDGVLPLTRAPWGVLPGRTSCIWSDLLEPYTSDSQPLTDGNRNISVLKGCPSFVFDGSVANSARTGYGMNPELRRAGNVNGNLTSWWADVPGTKTHVSFPLGQIPQSANRPLVGDSAVWFLRSATGGEGFPADSSYNTVVTPGQTPYSGDPWRHRKTSSYVFCDFHVDSLPHDAAAMAYWDPAQAP